MRLPSSLRQLWRRVSHLARLDLWFPQVPIAIAVAAIGMLALLPAVTADVGDLLHDHMPALTDTLRQFAGEGPPPLLRGVPNAVIGIVQIVAAIGLILRSRIVWVATLVMTLAHLVLRVGYDGRPFTAPTELLTAATFLALALSGRRFDRSSLAAGTLFAFGATVLFFAYGVLGTLVLGQGFDPPIVNVVQSIYFTVVTMSTVGYGDIVAKSDEARLFVISLIVIGITVFLSSLSALVGPLVQGRLASILNLKGNGKMRRVDHFVIAGTGILALNTVRELVARGLGVVVVTEDGDVVVAGAEMEVGDPADLEVLRRAGALDARAVLALTEDDADNAFIILALKELGATAKTVAAVSARKNMERVRRVQPDMIMAPNVFGGEVLAMALTEEQIDGQRFMERFLDVKPAPKA